MARQLKPTERFNRRLYMRLKRLGSAATPDKVKEQLLHVLEYSRYDLKTEIDKKILINYVLKHKHNHLTQEQLDKILTVTT